MGDGSTVSMTGGEIRRDVIEGSEAAAAKARVSELTEADVDYLVEMFTCRSRVWGVERGRSSRR
jgi:hypothetical protein